MVDTLSSLARLELESAHLRSLIDTLPDLVWLKDPDGVYLACNERFEQFYGAPRDRIVGATDYDFTDPEQATFFRAHDLAAVAAGSPTMNEEWITYASDGHQELLETIKTPMFDETGTLIGVLGIGRNITQRHEAAKRLQNTIDTVEALIVQLDAHGRVTLINQRAKTLLAANGLDAIGQDWFAMSAPRDEAEHYRQQVLHFMQNSASEVEESEIPLLTEAQQVRTISWVFRKLQNASGQLIGCLCAGIDITRRREEREQAQLATLVFQQAQEAIMVCGPDERIIQVNPAFTAITGYTSAEVIGKTPRCLASGRHTSEKYAEMWKTLADSGNWKGELWNQHRGGSHYLTNMNISVVRDELGRISHYVSVFTDVTLVRSQNERLRKLAHYDSLTGLPNRALLQDRLEQSLARSRRDKTNLAVCFIDLDNFKPVNDSFGHNVGDALLVAVAQRLRSVPREVDTVARYGGDEFVVVLNEVGSQRSCQRVAERILDALAKPIIVAGHELRVHASIGVTICPADGADVATLLRHADQAMYRAKLLGRNQIQFFDSAAESKFAGCMGRADSFRKALHGDELELFYQPKVALCSGEVVGFEALLRWRHPTRGLLTAGEFLPDLVDSSVAVELDQWVLDSALRQANQWHRDGVKVGVSVNIGAPSLQHPNFVSNLKHALRSYSDLPPSALLLEVVESATLGNIAKVRRVFDQCRCIGVRIALDDFGTGYSSLTYFRQLPIDEVKIDRSFVTELNRNDHDLAIVTNVTRLAKAFGRDVVAEGVESRATADALKEIGCEIAQGYGIVRPMAACEVIPWMRAHASTPSLRFDSAATASSARELSAVRPPERAII